MLQSLGQGTITNDAVIPHLLLIEDDDGLRRALQLLLTGEGFRVHAFARATLAINDDGALAASFLVIDYLLPERDGIGALGFLKERGWNGRAVLVTAYYSAQLRAEALQAGFVDVLPKPFGDKALLSALGRDASANGG